MGISSLLVVSGLMLLIAVGVFDVSDKLRSLNDTISNLEKSIKQVKEYTKGRF